MSIVKQTLPVLAAGLMIGAIVVTLCLSFASLIFGGALSGFIAEGTGMMLITAIVIGLIGSFTTSFPATIAIPQDRIVPLFAIMAAAIVASLPLSSPEAKFDTVVIAIHIATSITGLAFLLLGRFKLSGIMRYIPYPVIGGFLAGSGWLLLKGSLPLLTGLPSGGLISPLLFEPTHFFRWMPGIIAALLMAFITRRTRSPIVIPFVLLATAAVLYFELSTLGITIGDAMKSGWLVGAMTGKSMIGWHLVSALVNTNWHALSMQAGQIFTIVTISVTSLLLSATVLELDGDRDIDINRELTSCGYGNIVSAFAGGVIGFQSLNLTALNIRMGVRSRMTGLIVAAVTLFVLMTGTSLVAYMPYPVLGSLLFYLGLSFLIEWLYDAWFKLPLMDYLVIILILVTVGLFGYIVGVAIGTMMAMVLFAIQYSRINVVRATLTGTQVHSNVDRSNEAQGILADEGKKIAVLKLHGYLFFGTATDVLEGVKGYFSDTKEQAPHFIILEFSKVDGLDSSAIVAFTRMRTASAKYTFRLILAGMNKEIERQLRNEGILSDEVNSPMRFDDLDHALEYCENEILRAASITEKPTGNIHEQLQKFFRGAIDADSLIPFLKKMELKAGEVLIKEGSTANDMYFLESGTLTVELLLDGGKSLRIRRMRPGKVVGEMAYYNKSFRTASVVASDPCVVYQLSEASIENMEKNYSPLAILFHEQMAGILADRLLASNKALRAVVE